MSRHRAVRNLPYEDDLTDHFEDDHSGMTEEEAEQLERAYTQAFQTLEGTDISEKEIKDALWYYYFDVPKAVDWLLGQRVKKKSNSKVMESQSPKYSVSKGTLGLSPKVEDLGYLKPDPAAPKSNQPCIEQTGALSSTAGTTPNEPYPRKVSKLSALAKSRGTLSFSQGVTSKFSSGAILGKSDSEGSHKEILGPSNGRKSTNGHQMQKPENNFETQGALVPDLFATASEFAASVLQSSFSQSSIGTRANHRFVFPLVPHIAFTSFAPKHKRQSTAATNSQVVRSSPTSGGDKLCEPLKKINLETSPVCPASPYRAPKKKHIDEAVLNTLRNDANRLGLQVGHVDSGKSTLIGRLLHDLGKVEKRTMDKLYQESGRIGKSSFAFAWLLDGTEEERNRGVTMDIGIQRFCIRGRTYTLLDAPGHRDFVPNMIAGASQADFAVLVVDGSTGAFEAGFHLHGQTKEHALLARSLGVHSLLVAVNKLDNVQWSRERFETISLQMNEFLSRVGFDSKNLKFIPCSGLTGGNIITKPIEISSWPTQKTLLEEIESTEPISRSVDKPFRLSISDIYKGTQSGHLVNVAGRVSSGYVQVGDPVVCSNDSGFVKMIEVDEEERTVASAGNSVILGISGFDITHLRVGDVLCELSSPIQIVKVFEARIITFDMSRPLTLGATVVIHRGRTEEPAIVSKLVSVVDKTGAVIKKKPRHLTSGVTAVVELKVLGKGIPLETYTMNRDFGRIVLRYEGETLAAGVVQKLLLIDQ